MSIHITLETHALLSLSLLSLSHTQGVLEMHAERLEDQAEEREELWKAIEGLRLAEPSDITGFTEIDRAGLTFGSGMPLVRSSTI